MNSHPHQRQRAAQVILYSGGMDSVMLAHKYPDALRLYVDVRSRYADKELRHLPSDVVVNSGTLNLGPFERADAIIPGRNMMLAMVAAQFGNQIMLGATAGDLSTDKDETFASMATMLSSYMFSGRHFDGTWDVRVTLPIRAYCKVELVQDFLRHGGSPQALVDSVSCYHPEHVHCGWCKSCIRKWVAFEATGIKVPDDYWFRHPSLSPEWQDIVPKLLHSKGWRTEIEDIYTRAVLTRAGVMAPTTSRNLNPGEPL